MNGEYVIFRNHKAYLVDFDNKGKEKSAKELDSLTMHLQVGIKLEPGTLFDDVWAYIEKDWEFYDIVFNKSLGRFDLKLYVDQYKKPGKDRSDEDPDNSMHYLDITWYMTADSWDDQKTITTMAEFGGYGRSTEGMIDGTEPYDTAYGLSFTPINDMKGYDLKLDESVKFRHEDYRKINSKNAVFEVLFEGTREFDVYDVINAILFEISWHGAPSDQMATMADLEQTMAEVKDAMDRGDDSMFVDIEDVDVSDYEEGEGE